MKQFIVLGGLLFSFLFLCAQPKIQFKAVEYDFGSIKEDAGLATATFDFKNTGDQPLILNSVKASCGCTTPEWTQEPIAPGKSGTIKLAYNPKNRPGPFTKTATVNSNAEPSVMVLTIKGIVEPKALTIDEQYPREMNTLRWKSNYLSLGSMVNTQEKTEVLEYYNPTDKDVAIEIYRAPGHLQVTFEPQLVPPGKTGKMSVKYDAKKRNAFGYISDRIYLSIDGQKDNNYSVGVSVTINEDFTKMTEEEKSNAPVAVMENTVFDFGTIKEGTSVQHSFKLTNNGKSDLFIRSVKASCGCTAVKNESLVKAGLTTDIKIDFNSKGKRGRQNKSVTVITNDPVNSTINLRIMGNVLE